MHKAIQRGRSRFGGQCGFTLLEVIMVLLILGVISYFATTRLFTEDGISQVSEMDLVKNHLRYAQSRAMNTERNWGLVFEIPSKYWLYYENESGNKVAVRLPGDDTSTDNKMSLHALSIISIVDSLYSNEVRFFCGSADKPSNKPGHFGSPSASVGKDRIKIGTSAGEITISQNTGFIP